jgi:hypothetical protein
VRPPGGGGLVPRGAAARWGPPGPGHHPPRGAPRASLPAWRERGW